MNERARRLTARQARVLELLKGYSYNSYEACRILNGQGPHDFQGCFFKATVKNWGEQAADRCKRVERACVVYSRAVDKVLRSLERRGLVRSVKIRWFDGRKKGAAKDALAFDLFRLYYRTRAGLAQRLLDDITTHLLAGGD